jgi:hypothetical protein
VFIGDDERDGIAAAAAECPFQQVTSDRSLLDIARDLLKSEFHSETSTLKLTG